MKKQQQAQKHSSVRLGIFFVILVTITMAIALLYHTLTMYQKSLYENDQPFTMYIASKDSAQEIVLFNPIEKKITQLTTKKVIGDEPLTKKIGVPADARVYTTSISLQDTISQQLKTLFFRLPDAKTTLTLIDLSRLYFLAKTIPTSDIETIHFDEIKDVSLVQEKIEEQFLDTYMREDNKTVQIINASGISGMGSTVEKTINRLGAAVIDVSTARKEEQKTKIEFAGEETYTVQKMRKLFHVPITQISDEKISDIIIILGKDKPQLVD